MVTLGSLASLDGEELQAYRLVNSKFPPIDLFDDVADAADFEALYQLQALTNPRLLNEVGRLELIAREEIPFGIPGCSYATAPFTHVNADGSRFSDGSFGVLYLADGMDTAIAEVRYHQERYWSNVAGLNYERFVFRGLTCRFSDAGMRDATALPLSDPIYAPDDYAAAQRLGRDLKRAACPGLRYNSVRSPGNHCWALMTPRPVTSIIQAAHYEMIWSGQIISVNRIATLMA
ncbi:RES family NAD+ phosphorylase [Pseudomonas panipatensis]|uniref:RES domain-containing protein n=1 Tax=Pseudomonas panipatensis TaxID=428992 RepID=A0A1G8L2E4_9PSED|nr:RES family NAD+ phosphorylase [Pseudomonas panipatensis]SDI49798.1 RES domain-containing protein [Pseudomonas panipatensis]SMP72691.1 RES domain-containing protein [Pseudomonas panipatensis]